MCTSLWFYIFLYWQCCFANFRSGQKMKFRLGYENDSKQAFEFIGDTGENWRQVRNVLKKMAPTLKKSLVEIPILDPHLAMDKIAFQNIVIAKWIDGITFQHVSYFDTTDNEIASHNSNVFIQEEKVMIVNFTIPQLLFTGQHSLEDDSRCRAVTSVMYNMAVGMFMHFSKKENLIYIDNFQMLPPENLVLSCITNSRDKMLSKIDYDQDKIDIEWKSIMWLACYYIIEDYLGQFTWTSNKLSV